MAVNHVLLKEFHHEKKMPYFLNYAKQYTDSPYLVELTKTMGSGRRESCFGPTGWTRYQSVENGDWKFLMWDTAESRPKMPMGSLGSAGEKKKANGTCC